MQLFLQNFGTVSFRSDIPIQQSRISYIIIPQLQLQQEFKQPVEDRGSDIDS